MLILTETTDNLQVVLNGAITTNQMRCMACWRDITTSAFTPGRTVTDTNNTTDVNVVASPAASTQRVVDYLSIYNADTVAGIVTVKFDANGTEYILFKCTLSTGERLDYAEGQGFNVYNAQGQKKILNSTGAVVNTDDNIVVLGSDVTNNNVVANTIQDVTGLSFSVVSGNTYKFYFFIPYTAAASTTGSRWSVSGPSFTSLYYRADYTLTTSTATISVQTGYDLPATSNATSVVLGNTAEIVGVITPSADGTVIARFASEISLSAITAKAGAYVNYQQVL